MKTAWYLGHKTNDVGDRALLVGDPDRIDRIASLLEDARMLPVKRGLKTVTGGFAGKTITAVAFGMGAPIATVVLHELADLGVAAFMRIGTAMYFPPVKPGQFVLSDGVVSFEGTSRSYVGDVNAHTADPALNDAVVRAATQSGETIHRGTFATFDAFYRDMFALDEAGRQRVLENREGLSTLGAVAADMETSALVNAAHALGVRFTSLCVGTVDAATHEKLAPEAMERSERLLFDTSLKAIAAH